ncbi:inactive N-acetylated-alpha-linked acidic dipeptidase-like protein 2 [Scomber scombrus]|uniref:Inactive N-acetylated-alpha-linked acidic dipeptidase-like protein 2 n=1 Tax=Scomber scombrus TaxID=13677 RepID=A0AAV1PZG5_SCOSC
MNLHNHEEKLLGLRSHGYKLDSQCSRYGIFARKLDRWVAAVPFLITGIHANRVQMKFIQYLGSAGTFQWNAQPANTERQLLSCIRGGNCPGPNVTSLQLPGDVSFFANQLAVPTLEFAFEQTRAEETTSFLSEAQFSAESPETLDPLFKFHETIAKMTAEAILRLVNDPVLPFYPLDIALDVQNKLKDKSAVSPALLSSASSLRDHAAFFQSETMRPANDPKERDPSHVRMLNDVLRDLEKSFIIPHPPPGVYRNLLYSLPGKTPHFSIFRFSQEALLRCKVSSKAAKRISAYQEEFCHSTVNQSLSLILRAIRSAERLVCFGMDLFENYPNDTI